MIDELRNNITTGHDMGWSFTPLNGKRPILKGWQDRPRESLEDALAWAGQGNVGLRTGQASGVVAIDLDQYKPEYDPQAIAELTLPPTVTAVTGRGGKCLLYHTDQPIGNSAGKLAPAVDVKGDAGQVVFPGSIHPETGQPYTWAEGLSPWDVEMVDLPQHVIDLLNAPTLAPPRPTPPAPHQRRPDKSPEQRYASMALRLELNELYKAREGTRNDTLNKAAFSLGTLIGGGYLDRSEVEQALQAAAQSVGLSDHEAQLTVRSGLDSGIQHPRQVQTRKDAHAVVETATGELQDIPVLTPGKHPLDLYGNADRFMFAFGRDVHWCEERGKWFVWDGRCWRMDAIRDMNRMSELTMRALMREAAGDEDAMKWAVRCNKDARAGRDMLEVVKHRSAIPMDALDRHSWLLGCDNGIIDLRTGELLEHDRKWLITTLSPAQYDPEHPCQRWQQFLSEITDGNEELVSALQRLCGYFLTGDVSVQILPIFYGPGGNGKNVFLDTIMGILGPYAEEAPDGLVTSKASDEHPTEIADLYGKRLIVASETEENKKLRIGLVKKITGNKYLKGRFMRQDYFQFERTHKTILVTNNKPIVTESSNAIWRRLRLIPFDVIIPEHKQDRQLTEKLVAEWPGILAWAVRGCIAWQQRQCDLEFPQSVLDATADYRNDSDHVADFITECCEDWREHPQQNMRAPKERVYLAYCSWCRDVGEDVVTRNAFNSRLRVQGYVDKPLWVESRTQKCWLNLTLKGN